MLCTEFNELLLKTRNEFIELSEWQTNLLHVFGYLVFQLLIDLPLEVLFPLVDKP